MKKSLFYSLSGLLLFLIIGGFNIYSIQDKSIPGIPEHVNQIIQNHCYGCHNNNGKNEDAKKELNFDEWGNYSMMKKSGKLNDINEIINEGKMPPEKFLKKYPDKKLSDEQVRIFSTWINRRQIEKL